MEHIQKVVYFIILIGIAWIPPHNLGTPISTDNNPPHCSVRVYTELNISTVELIYDIRPNGIYSCKFTLDVVGNSLTESGSVLCEFLTRGVPINNFTLGLISGSQVVPLNLIREDSFNTTKISFSDLNTSIPRNFPFKLSGAYQGIYTENNSGVFTFDLGIDWGTTVPTQYVWTFLDDDYSIIETYPIYHSLKSERGKIELLWVSLNTRFFNAFLTLQLRNSVVDYLHVSLSEWNASIKEVILILIQNLGLYPIEGYIHVPEWITRNTSSFSLLPDQQIIVELAINSQATLGLVGNIEIWVEYNKPKLIPVRVINNSVKNNSFPLSQSLALLSLILILGVSIYQKKAILEFSSKFRANFFDNSDEKQRILSGSITDSDFSKWKSIQTKWEPILPKNEFIVIKILYRKGLLNQKTLACKVGVSEMTMSRIISRLELKQLVSRESLGMSNMIALNLERL